MPGRDADQPGDADGRERAFDAACGRARRRYAAALLVLALPACKDRERWPEPERSRPQPAQIANGSDLDCVHGDYCGVAGDPPANQASSSFGNCEAVPDIPAEVVAKTAEGRRPMLRVRFDSSRTQRERVAGHAEACCYFWYEHCHGRPILAGGRALLPRPIAVTRARRSPAGLVSRIASLDPAIRATLGRSWARVASFEHASIASFERAAVDLERLGAPAALVEQSRRAALDEARHAAIAFGLASAFAGRALGPGPLRLPRRRPPSLAALAASTYAEGCVAETIAASLVREAARRTEDADVRRSLLAIARDEDRHATLAWKTIAWALAAGGEPVRRAVASRARAVLASWTRLRTRRAIGSTSEDFGVLAETTRRTLARHAFDRIVRPCTEGLLREAAP